MNKKQKNTLIRIIATAILIVIMKFIEDVNELLFLIVFVIAYILIGYDILKKAFKGIFHKQLFDENFLMAIATLGSILLKDYEEGIFVMLFYQVGELFQSIAIGKSRRNISELMDIRPDYANKLINDSFEKIDPSELLIGDTILVKVGEKVPVDGIIIEGKTSLNMSALTGESIPNNVSIDDEVISGSINMESPIKIKVTKLFEESTASKILDLVENATSNKSKSENYITKFAKWYTPIVCGCALLLVIAGPLFSYLITSQANFSDWATRALTFLVISCPCALVISIPLSFFGGIGGASSNGILIKGSNYLEKLAKIDAIAFDKTGTITKGIFEVTTIHNSNISEEELLKIAAHCESLSTHPIAKSIIKEYGNTIDATLLTSVKEIHGKGLKAIYNNLDVIIGNDELMKENNINYVECKEAGTILHIAVNNEYKGHIHIGDIIKSSSKEALEQLRNSSIKKIYMLTGDNQRATNDIIKDLSFDTVYHGLLPDEKVRIIKELNATHNMVAFVGDGINDAPTLKEAGIGISMGSLGSDAAIEAADVVLMDDDPLKITKAIKIAKKCMRIVHENIYFAIAVKIICLLLGAFGYVRMWLAIFSDVGVMIIAVINSLRALNTRIL